MPAPTQPCELNSHGMDSASPECGPCMHSEPKLADNQAVACTDATWLMPDTNHNLGLAQQKSWPNALTRPSWNWPIYNLSLHSIGPWQHYSRRNLGSLWSSWMNGLRQNQLNAQSCHVASTHRATALPRPAWHRMSAFTPTWLVLVAPVSLRRAAN
jgi:hypothetical protein